MGQIRTSVRLWNRASVDRVGESAGAAVRQSGNSTVAASRVDGDRARKRVDDERPAHNAQ